MVFSGSAWLRIALILVYLPGGFSYSVSAETKLRLPALLDDTASSVTALDKSKIQGKSLPNLPSYKEFITTHDPQTGRAVFSDFFPRDVPSPTPNDPKFTLLYSSDGFPVDMDNGTDIDLYDTNRNSRMALVNPRGSVIRYVDFEPGDSKPVLMHRTISLDYGILMEGELELILDSGEKRMLNRGDVAIQRGTKHAWRNPSPTKWARMLFIMQASEPVVINGEALREEYAPYTPK
jgi:quercetin dioxygenase-like cupin family protein